MRTAEVVCGRGEGGGVSTGLDGGRGRRRAAHSWCTSGSCRARRSCRSARGAGRERGRQRGASARAQTMHLLDAVCARQQGNVRRCMGERAAVRGRGRNASAQRIDWSWSLKCSRPAAVE